MCTLCCVGALGHGLCSNTLQPVLLRARCARQIEVSSAATGEKLVFPFHNWVSKDNGLEHVLWPDRWGLACACRHALVIVLVHVCVCMVMAHRGANLHTCAPPCAFAHFLHAHARCSQTPCSWAWRTFPATLERQMHFQRNADTRSHNQAHPRPWAKSTAVAQLHLLHLHPSLASISHIHHLHPSVYPSPASITGIHQPHPRTWSTGMAPLHHTQTH